MSTYYEGARTKKYPNKQNGTEWKIFYEYKEIKSGCSIEL